MQLDSKFSSLWDIWVWILYLPREQTKKQLFDKIHLTGHSQEEDWEEEERLWMRVFYKSNDHGHVIIYGYSKYFYQAQPVQVVSVINIQKSIQGKTSIVF